MTKILVTGASGFIGSFIVEEALNQGMEVWAAMRKSSSKAFLNDERIKFIQLDLSNADKLKEQLAEHQFDYVVHAAGVTKSIHQEDFYKVNTEGTKNLANVILQLKMPLKRFVYLSSLSIFGPVHEQQPYKEIREDDIPQPNTAYGRSKLQAEGFLDSLADKLPFVVLRPTGVYGPRERDYFMMAKSIKSHTDFAVGFKKQDITFIYVSDVVQAVFLALNKGKTGRKYFLSDGLVYNSRDFSDLIKKEMGVGWTIRIKAPLWVLRAVTFCGEHIGRWSGKISALNNDKYHILKQRNWRCDITPAINELGYKPKVQLPEGVKRTIAWYKDNGWL